MNSTPQIPDPRPVYAAAAEQLFQLISTIKPGQLDHPTPCHEYDVRALLGHVVSGARRIATVPEGGDGVGKDVPEWIDEVPAERWAELYDEGRARMNAAWSDDAVMDAVVTVPWGSMPGRIAMAGSVMETVTHTWDLARALGRDDTLEEGPAHFALAAAQRALPAEGREGAPFGEARQVPEDANVYVRLAAWLGRDPEWKTAPGRH
ncbi:TIGR03086 family protein [Streptomyces diacarni]|uniref:TIGR03086 family protein n=1 Tax=Streptomyces diacarni TaxID=2800381 RepID=A0A367E8F9_9ACTN|nr:TIGR03086 family metal-binding protein [Streptomyces diacarni]RCG13945.1 TIGR03086 family protein [Streptomyces diacarni]